MSRRIAVCQSVNVIAVPKSFPLIHLLTDGPRNPAEREPARIFHSLHQAFARRLENRSADAVREYEPMWLWMLSAGVSMGLYELLCVRLLNLNILLNMVYNHAAGGR